MSVWDGKLLKYGPIMGEESPTYPMVMKASEVFKNQYGRFVVADATAGTIRALTTSDAKIFGWVQCEGMDNLPTTATLSYTASAGDVRPVVLGNAPVVYRIPNSGTAYAVTMVGDRCDITSSAGTQTAVAGTDNQHHVIIVGGGNTAAGAALFIDCIINPAILGSA